MEEWYKPAIHTLFVFVQNNSACKCIRLMALHKTVVTPLPMQWSYHSLVFRHNSYWPVLYVIWTIAGDFGLFLFIFQKPSEDKYPVGPWLLALFLFVVCGSGGYCHTFPCHAGIWRSLMPWQIRLLGHQQPWYWLGRINGLLSSKRKDLNHPHNLSLGNVKIFFIKWIQQDKS